MIRLTYHGKYHLPSTRWKHSLVMVGVHILSVADAFVFLASLTLLSSDFSAKFLFSEAVTNFTEPT